jgi:molecular chaperone GrpE
MTWHWWLMTVAATVMAVAAGFLLGRLAVRDRTRTLRAPEGPAPDTLLGGVIEAHDLSSGADAVQVRLEQALAAAGVHRMSVGDGTVFDPGLHHAVGTVPLVDGGTDRRVAREVRPGWQMGDRVVRPAEVIVWTR